MQLGISLEELWDELEPILINLKNNFKLDPVLVSKVDSLINCYNGSLSVDNGQDAILDNLTTIIDVLNQKTYYTNRSIDTETKNRLKKLCDDLDLFRQVLVNEINIKQEKINIQKEKDKENRKNKPYHHNDEVRLPNLDTSKEEKLYIDINKK